MVLQFIHNGIMFVLMYLIHSFISVQSYSWTVLEKYFSAKLQQRDSKVRWMLRRSVSGALLKSSQKPCEIWFSKLFQSHKSRINEVRVYEDWMISNFTCNGKTWNDLNVLRLCLQKVGCDWQVDSDAVEDKCGVCLGDGKLCSTQRGFYNVTDGDGGLRLLRT